MVNGQAVRQHRAPLRAVRLVLESFKDKLRNGRIWWFTDNQNVVRIIQYGSPKPLLQIEAIGIAKHDACVGHS